MRRDELPDLAAFLAVAEERSFTRAAVQLATSQSALSQAIRRLETRLGVRLLTRTTRSVATTEAGEQLRETLRPAFDDINARLNALGELRKKPAGIIRITTSQHAAETILWPRMATVLPHYPDITMEVSTDSALTDIVSDRFDAGIRLGERVDKDMIAVRISPDLRMVVVGAPSYIEGRSVPVSPHDLTHHACINIRLPSSGGLYVWEFGKEGRELKVRVDGPLIFNNTRMVVQAALQGFGVAFIFEDLAAKYLAAGDLVKFLDDWTPPFSGYHLYYPSRRQQSPAFTVLLNALRFPAQG